MQFITHLIDFAPLVFGMLVPPPVQTTYIQYVGPGMNGMPATTTGWDVDTRIFEDQSVGQVGIGFGLAVCQGASDKGCRLGLMSGRSFVGITRADKTLPGVQGTGTTIYVDAYANGENVNVHVRGDIWVTVGTNVAADGQVYCNTATGLLGASGIANASQITNARWQTSASTSGLAVVRLGFLAGL
jgi:hypothetical protein